MEVSSNRPFILERIFIAYRKGTKRDAQQKQASKVQVISDPSLLAFYRVLNVVMATREFRQPIRLCVWEKRDSEQFDKFMTSFPSILRPHP